MKKYLPLLILMVLVLISCSKPTDPIDNSGSIPLRMDLSPAMELGYQIDSVAVRISKGSFSQQQSLTISGNTAQGVFEGLEPGIYAINVWVYEAGRLLATGQGTGNVIPGETTTVNITLQFVTGALEVNVSWAVPYQESRRILLVGNSFTYYNNGVHWHLQALIDSIMPSWDVVVSSVTMGGATLQDHLENSSTTNMIREGDWDLVILQEQSSRPISEPEAFYNAAIGLNTLIQNAGARTGFFMTWAYRDNPEMYIPLRDAYNYIGAYLDALVVPAGVAFYNASQDYPELNLYAPDNYHPRLHGTYLVACLMLAEIWGINPIGNSYIPQGLTREIAQQLQTIAWHTAQEYHDPGSLGRLPLLPDFEATGNQLQLINWGR